MGKFSVSKDEAAAFADACAFLRASYCHFKHLFEGSKLQEELLEANAPTFFGDLSQILKEYLILQICRLTDAEAMGGKSNLTVSYFVDNSDFGGDVTLQGRVFGLSKSLHDFRVLVLPARHKLIGHQDRKAILAGGALGAAPQIAWDQFWNDLTDFVEIIYSIHVDKNGHFRIDEIGGLSDADNVVEALKESAYFRAAISDKDVGDRVVEIAFASPYNEA